MQACQNMHYIQSVMHYDKLPFYDLSLRIRQASRIDKLPIDRYVLYLHREQSEPYNPTYTQQTEATAAALHSGFKWLCQK